MCSVNRGIRIRFFRFLKRSDEIVVVGRIAILECFSASRRNPLAADEVFVFARRTQALRACRCREFCCRGQLFLLGYSLAARR